MDPCDVELEKGLGVSHRSQTVYADRPVKVVTHLQNTGEITVKGDGIGGRWGADSGEYHIEPA